jgi:hypothetical protein
MFLSCMPVILPVLTDLGNWGEIPMLLGTLPSNGTGGM